MDNRSGKNKEMPYKVRNSGSKQERNDSNGINNSANKYPQAEIKIIAEKIRKKHQCAPTQDHVQGNVHKTKSLRTENTNESNAGSNNCPLYAKEYIAKKISKMT